jgi:glycosyltransferase involved in cell wall biosynthesis
MRVLMLSKALVTGVYQKKLEELAKFPDIELLTVVPPYWLEGRVGSVNLSKRYVEGYELEVEPMRFNGRHHVHFYPGLANQMRRFKPDIVHIDEEPYNLVTAHATMLAHRFGAKTVFFAFQNLNRRYPPPFSLIERYSYAKASAAIAGNQDAAEVLERKGFRQDIVVIPQFGVDPDIYRPIPRPEGNRHVPTLGYIGRIVPEKGLETLIHAVSKMPSRPHVFIVGSGSHRLTLQHLAERLGVRDRVQFRSAIPPEHVPAMLSEFDALVLPSLTQKNWAEQFGRVLIEAMACEVPVLGSDSGEIPNVVGEGGLIFPEGNAEELAKLIKRLLEDAEYRRELGRAGRQRVLDNYTQERVAQQTRDVYLDILNPGREKSPAAGASVQPS